MTAARQAQWSDGAAGPLLRLASTGDPHDVVWQDFALCAEVAPDQWFPPDGESYWAAMTTCRRCPVRAQCLEAAQTSPDPVWGVWGGVFFVDGKVEATEVRCQRDLHELDEENTRVTPAGKHVCRACIRDGSRARKAAA